MQRGPDTCTTYPPSPQHLSAGLDHTGWNSCLSGNYESSSTLIQSCYVFGPRVESPQPGIKPFPTLLTAHFRAVSYKPVAAICIKVGSFVHEEEYRRNMKSLFPVLTAQTFRRACINSWKFVLFEHRPPIKIMTDHSELVINKQRFFIGKYRRKYLQKQQHSHINTLTS